MTRWRLAVGGVLVLVVALPLAAPFAELLAHPDAWAAFAEPGRLLSLAKNTLLLIGGTLALTLPAGAVGAVLLYRTDLPFRRPLQFLAMLGLFVPLPLVASGWQAALGSGGWLPLASWTTPPQGDPDVSPTGIAWKPWAQGVGTAVWVHAALGLPWVVWLVGQGLCWVEPELEEDALTAAGPCRVLWSVTLRRSAAAVAAAGLWVALQAATEVTVTDMMQVRTFGEEVYNQFVRSDRLGVGGPVAVNLPPVLLTALVVAWAARRWERSLPPLRTFAAEPYVFRLGWLRWPCLLLAVAVVALVAGVPGASLAWKAGLSGTPREWSAATVLLWVDRVVHLRGGLVLSSLGLAAAAGAAAAALALLTCWLAVGARGFRWAVLALLAVAWALPGPIVGLGMLAIIDVLKYVPVHAVQVAFYYGPSPLPGVWVDVVRFFPCAVALLWPVVRLLPPELREAARVDGAGPAQEFGRVVAPLTAVPAARAALAVAVLALGELGASKL
ncbi:MAG TPA: ABC transporter permease subunit, partial [Gemmataceae bacterium]|nr:ABC transporter permease subunit [Gemmataceae bacterium]